MTELRLDPAFVEEAVFLELRRRAASGDAQPARAFQDARAAIYDVHDGRERETAFQRLATLYFISLGFRELFAARLEECPRLSAQLEVAVVRRVWTRKEERVEFYVARTLSTGVPLEASTSLLMGLTAGRCVDRTSLVAFLRHELMHVADMLDPAFAYGHDARLGGECNAAADLIRERFRLLWDLWVHGRMQRLGWGTVVDETTRVREFERLSGSWEPQRRDALWRALRSRERWTQRELLELAREARPMPRLECAGRRLA